MVERSVLKRNAKDQLRGKWGLAIAAFIVSGIICGIISCIGSIAESEEIMIIGYIVAIIISGPMCYGLCTFILNIVRGKDASISDIFAGFNGKVIIKAFIIMILTSIAITIGYIILIIPGIILSIMFSQSFFILVDNNDLSAIDCMKLSCEMMKGNKMYLFVMFLSFLGWYILGTVTCGIGFLWIAPYYNITLGNFYEELKGNTSGSV
ncbi:MAG: DUF975 family protein [Clostridium sp.]